MHIQAAIKKNTVDYVALSKSRLYIVTLLI